MQAVSYHHVYYNPHIHKNNNHVLPVINPPTASASDNTHCNKVAYHPPILAPGFQCRVPAPAAPDGQCGGNGASGPPPPPHSQCGDGGTAPSLHLPSPDPPAVDASNNAKSTVFKP